MDGETENLLNYWVVMVLLNCSKICYMLFVWPQKTIFFSQHPVSTQVYP